MKMKKSRIEHDEELQSLKLVNANKKLAKY